MSIDENQKIELFDRFYTWLKEDGLKPKKSERLHKKKIFASLLANDVMTIENFEDFLRDFTKKQKSEFEEISYSDIEILKQLTAKQIYQKKVEDLNFENPDLLKRTNFTLEQLVSYARDFEAYLKQELKKVSTGNSF